MSDFFFQGMFLSLRRISPFSAVFFLPPKKTRGKIPLRAVTVRLFRRRVHFRYFRIEFLCERRVFLTFQHTQRL